ncbi:hypothetical protein FDP41_013349 [Naegleria fowleri]|uniref:Vacuolar protein sorting-associated protein 28 homolog n=1 Tax=Naegleria fowleri TaxID=5763 RepID=A0A6A5BTP4_NAEFO|nr:uncharacterized protein FDP41_013349 [Naegleria fowleri]KAF0980567.1 hypothetical protein FDP41_013349 [Naegleria fowleri]
MQRTFSYSSQQYGASTPPPSSSSGTTTTTGSSSSISPVNSGSSVSPSQQKQALKKKLNYLKIERKEKKKAYVKDSIMATEYADACRKLIAKFKTIQPIVSADVPDIERFMKEYRLDCPAATNRLLKVGVPATVEHGGKDPNQTAPTVKLIAQATQYFITVMDTIKLGLLAKDQLAPILVDLMDSLNSLHIKDFEGKTKIRDWTVTFNQMKAHESIDEDQARQLYYDIEQAYNQFHKVLQ